MPKHKLCILVYSPQIPLRRRKKLELESLKIIINSSSAWPLHTQVLSLPLLLHFSWEKMAIYYFRIMYGKLPSILLPFSFAYECPLRTRISFYPGWSIHIRLQTGDSVIEPHQFSLSITAWNFPTELLPTGSKFYLLPSIYFTQYYL